MTPSRLRVLRPAVVFAAAALAAVIATQGAVSSDRPAPRFVLAAGGTTPAAVNLMPLGDSITAGVGSRTNGAYRSDLYARLIATGLNVDFVGSRSNGVPGSDTDHEGHSGWNIEQVAARTDGWLAAYQPDVVLLHLGMNDLKKAATAPGAKTRLAALVNRIRRDRPAAHIFVAKISGSVIPAVQARVNDYNAAIPFIVAARGPFVHLVDQSSVRGLNLLDSVHPNDFGYTKMSYNWFHAMKTVFRGPGTTWAAGVNPYAATRAYLCVNAVRTADGRVVHGCHWWQLRNVTESRTERVPAGYRRSTVNGKKIKTWVRGHDVTRTRTVKRWTVQA